MCSCSLQRWLRLRNVSLEHPFQEAAMPHELQHNDGVGGQGEQLSELKAAALEAAANAIAITDREGIIV
jgi:hypothetical protein